MYIRAVLLFVISVFILDCCGGPDAAYDRNDVVTIRGRFLDQNGKPLKNREIGFWVKGIELFNQIPDFKAVTDKNGRFMTRQVGKHFMWLNERTRYTTVANYHYQDEPVTYMGFYPVKQDIELPDARLWRANLSRRVSEGKVTFKWKGIDEVSESPAESFTFSARTGSDWNLWIVEDVQSGFSLPSYVFQNSCTGWKIAAEIPGETSYDVDWIFHSKIESGSNVIPEQELRLLSGGKRCYVEKQDLRYAGITDQRWDEQVNFANPDTTEPEADFPSWIMIDLGRRQSISALALYGVDYFFTNSDVGSPGFEVYVSGDISRWGEPVAEIAGEGAYLHAEFNPVMGRYVRLSGYPGSGIKFSELREISVFGP